MTEFSLGVNLMSPSFPFLSKEVEPSLTFMTQRAYYGQFRPAGGDVEKDNVKNFMDYEFRMINLAGASQVSKEWRVTGAVEYDELRSFRTGQKMYYSFSPIFSITKYKAGSKSFNINMLEPELGLMSNPSLFLWEKR